MSIDQAKVEHYKTKLAYLVTHESELEDDKKEITGGYNTKIKHIRRMKDALAEAIRFKSDYVLEEELGRSWEEDIEGIQAIIPKIKPRKDLLARAISDAFEFGGEFTLVKTKDGAAVYYGHPLDIVHPEGSLGLDPVMAGYGETIDQAVANLLERAKKERGE